MHDVIVARRAEAALKRPAWRRPGQTCGVIPADDDLATLSHDELVQEVIRLRDGIRQHRDSTGHELCWHHPQLWSLLPESTDPAPTMPEWPQFMRGCIRYRQSLDGHLPPAQSRSRTRG